MQLLDGRWEIARDPGNIGLAERWFERRHAEAQAAPVPGIIQPRLWDLNDPFLYRATAELVAAGAGGAAFAHAAAVRCGFRDFRIMVRFISGMAWPEQLDFCDEIGLMVYEESLAGWLLADSPKMAERFDRSIREMVLRDRNHPSLRRGACYGIRSANNELDISDRTAAC